MLSVRRLIGRFDGDSPFFAAIGVGCYVELEKSGERKTCLPCGD